MVSQLILIKLEGKYGLLKEQKMPLPSANSTEDTPTWETGLTKELD